MITRSGRRSIPHACLGKQLESKTVQKTNSEDINLLLIADSSERAGLLRQSMELQGISGVLRRVEPGNGASAYVRRIGVYKQTTPPDLVLLDFTRPDSEKLSLLKDIAFGDKRSPVPVIILTSESGERAITREGLNDDSATMFSPTDLACFLSKMRTHRRRRFMRALDVMYQLGPVMVRMPRSFVHTPHQYAALSA